MAERTADGQFAPGHSKIEGSGAKLGQKRRSTQMVDRLFTFFEDEKIQESLIKDWWQLEAKEKWDVYTKCMKFMAPTVSAITFGDDQQVSSIMQLVQNMAQYRKK